MTDPLGGSGPEVLEVGRIAKAHGIKGEVLVALTGDRTERVQPGVVLRTGGGRDLVVRTASPHQGKWIVRFEGVATRTEAEALHGQSLHAEPIDDPDALFVHDLIGSTVVDASTGAELGAVAAVEANPASDLLVLAGSGALIPVRFVVDRDPASRRLRVEIPEGLLDL
ncbi:MAG TPA: ribosome maturation factor RimM [Acidimicrobiales bacterium]|nr:ribosome maturation factor RimM [Acidimicrobiales bacterium]